MISFSVLNRIAQSMRRMTAMPGDSVRVCGASELAVLEKGSVSVSWCGVPYDTLKAGGFWGEVTILHHAPALFDAHAEMQSSYFLIPGDAIKNIPIVRWRLTEEFRKRLSWFRTQIRVEWNEDFASGDSQIDEQHRMLFHRVRDIVALNAVAGDECARLLDSLRGESHRLFRSEEAFMASISYPGLEQHHAEHERMLAQLEKVAKSAMALEELRHETIGDFLKDWLFTHTMIEDRKVKPFFDGLHTPYWVS
jgi:hemerythrin